MQDPREMTIGWVSVATKYPYAPRGEEASAFLHQAYRDVFGKGNATDEQKQAVLADILKASSYYQTLDTTSINGFAHDANFNAHFNGKRFVGGHILRYLAGVDCSELRLAAQLEKQVDDAIARAG